MRRKVGLVLSAIITAVFTMGILSGCDCDGESEKRGLSFDVKIDLLYNFYYDYSGNPLKKSFCCAEKNQIRSVGYLNENYNPSDPESDMFLPYIDNLPSSRIILLTEQMQLEEAFEKVPDIDLGTKMVIIILTSYIGNQTTWIDNIKIENGILEVIIGRKYEGQTTAPRLMGFGVHLDKADITDAKVTTFVERKRRKN